jgi:hypothetical protein
MGIISRWNWCDRPDSNGGTPLRRQMLYPAELRSQLRGCWPNEDSQRVQPDGRLPADFSKKNRLPTHYAEDSRLQQSWDRHRNPQQARLLAHAPAPCARLSSINPSLVGSKDQLSDRGGIRGRHNLARTGRSVEPGRGARPSRAWCRREESNPRPSHYECAALPSELRRRRVDQVTGRRRKSGAVGRARTADLFLTKEVLYLLSYNSEELSIVSRRAHEERVDWLVVMRGRRAAFRAAPARCARR